MAYRSNPIKKSKNCKFCKDSGKHENIYNSHNVKDKNGTVCCPILMTTLCNNCGNFGHTNKYCKSIKIMFTNQKPTNTMRVEIKKNNVSMTTNRFAVFDDDDHDVDKDSSENTTISYPLRRRIENWADYCSDTDDE
jgi:hypothetical protein